MITLVFISSTQVGHVESVDLGDIKRKRITRAMKPPIFGKKQDMQGGTDSSFDLWLYLSRAKDVLSDGIICARDIKTAMYK